MKLTQKFLRYIINRAVERFFPDSMFYGNDLPTKWGADCPYRAMASETAAISLAVQCELAGAGKMIVDVTGASYKGEDIGDWQVTIQRMKGGDA